VAIGDFCLRPEALDVLFVLNIANVNLMGESGATFLRVYRAAIEPDGTLGPVTLFTDLGDSYDGASAWIERVRCHPETDQVLLSVANRERMNSADEWWAELRLLDAGGPAVDGAFAREIGPANVAWSPDGLRLLLEASPVQDAGTVFVLDLATGQSTPIEGARVELPAGAGGGWIHWDGNNTAVLESILVAGVEARALDVVDVSGPRPSAGSHRDLPDALSTTVDPDGGMIALVAGERRAGSEAAGETTAAPLAAFRWDPARPDAALIPMGELALGADPMSLHIADPVVLANVPGDAADARVVFIASVDSERALILGDLSGSGPPDAWKLSPEGRSVQSVRASGGWLVYRMWVTERELAAMAFDISTQLRVIPPDALEPARMDANPAFRRVAQP
jgi:hypothetical protein